MPHAKTCVCDQNIKTQVQHFFPLIKKIGKAKSLRDQRQLFESGPSKCLTKFLSECSGALLRRDIRLPSYKNIKKFKKQLIFLADPKTSIKQKQIKFASKRGGFLSLLPIIGGILANTVIPLIIEKFRKH